MNKDRNPIGKQTLSGIKKLHQKKFREETGLFIIEGWKSVEEALNARVTLVTVLYDAQSVSDSRVLTGLRSAAQEIHSVTAKEIDSVSDTATSQGIVAVAKMFRSPARIDETERKAEGVIVALDAMNDPGNLGTIIRTCDWFGADALLIGKRSVDMYNPKVVRATMGSLFHLPISDNVDLAAEIGRFRASGWTIYAAEIDKSDDIDTVSFSKASLIIIGSESHGISKELSEKVDRRIRIPQYGKAESLNAAIACGVILSKVRNL